MAGTKITHVPYRGVPPAVLDVIANRVSMMFAGYGVVSSYIKAGSLKALAVTGPQRLKQAPDLPTVSESGLLGFDMTTWTGLFAPGGTPEPIVVKLNSAVNAILSRPDIRANLEGRGFIVDLYTPARVGQEVQHDMDVLGALIKKSGITVD